MADALLSPTVAIGVSACSMVVAGYCLKKVREEDDPKKIPLMGVLGAFVFAAQMINFTIPGTGSSGHLCGGMLLSAVLGPYAGFLTMIGVLLVQCLLFADGGLLALGANVWNMAFYSCFVGSLVIWQSFVKTGLSRGKIILASIIGSILTLQLGAFSVTLETLLSGITALPFGLFVLTMQPIHLAIGLVEGLITAAVLLYIYDVRPSLLYGNAKTGANDVSISKIVASLGIVTAFIGGGLSLVASELPDGLEWSMEKVAGTSELEASGSMHETAAFLQELTAFLPDYALPGSESVWGTVLSGLLGSLIVAGICIVAANLFKMFKSTAHE
ncbi:MAG: energy-coupling factor ABC transporter permease [Phascolarctobacterium sp.]|nr:energy-coupling factor ABC transporter permease [Phascolarctobacterium sp.]